MSAVCHHNNPKEHCIDCGTAQRQLRLAKGKAANDLLDAIVEAVAARLEKVLGNPISAETRAALATLQPSTLKELLLGADTSAGSAPSNGNPYVGDQPPTAALGHGPAPIDLGQRLRDRAEARKSPIKTTQQKRSA